MVIVNDENDNFRKNIIFRKILLNNFFHRIYPRYWPTGYYRSYMRMNSISHHLLKRFIYWSIEWLTDSLSTWLTHLLPISHICLYALLQKVRTCFCKIQGVQEKLCFFHNLLQPLPRLHCCKRPSKLSTQC